MSDTNPWADPNTPTEPGQPYTGPPSTVQPPAGASAAPYGAPGWPGVPGYGPPGYGPPGYPPYGYPWPPAPRRPGQVIAAAVLAFVQGALVLLASVYVILLSSLVGIAATSDPGAAAVGGLAGEGTVLGFVQVASAVLLVVAGVLVLGSRRRRALVVLLVAFGVQVLLCVYWAVRLTTLAADIPGSDPTGAFLAFTLLFLAGPAVGLGLLLIGAGRRWFDSGPAGHGAA